MIDSNAKIHGKTFIDILVLLYFLFEVVSAVISGSNFLKIRYLFPFVALITIIISNKCIININRKIIGFLVAYTFLGALPAGIHNGNMQIEKYILCVSSFVMAYVLLKAKIDNWAIECNFYFYTVIFVAYMFLGNSSQGVSENYISIYYIILLFVYFFNCRRQNVQYKRIYIYISLLMSLAATGRGGIMAMGIVILIILLGEKKTKNHYLLLLVLIMIALLTIFSSDITSVIMSGFSDRGLDSNGRFLFWLNYLNDCKSSIANIFFGVNFAENLSQYYYVIPHLHNSFLTLYGQIGLIMALVLVINFIKQTVIFIKEKEYGLFAVSIAFLFRSFTDLVFGGYIGDVVVFVMLLNSIRMQNYEKK